jgi:hypothetical protein
MSAPNASAHAAGWRTAAAWHAQFLLCPAGRGYAAAERDGFTRSVHCPHTIIEEAIGNAMNMGTTLSAYASICKERGRPFTVPGSAAQDGVSEMTDTRSLAKQLV